MIKVADFMTKELVTVKETDDLALAESILRLGGIRHLPVVRDRKLVGLVTHRDLLRSGASRNPTARAIQAQEIMTRSPTVVGPATSLAHATHLMLRHKYGCLPVCEEDGTLIGIIIMALLQSGVSLTSSSLFQDCTLNIRPHRCESTSALFLSTG